MEVEEKLEELIKCIRNSTGINSREKIIELLINTLKQM